jgi:phospholipid-translocating ATPase
VTFKILLQDIEVNNRRVKVHKVDGIFEYTAWKNLKVGNIVKVEKDEFFPADLVLLSSSYEDAVCYVETMNLDGETNLKLKQGLEVTSFLHDDLNFKKFKATVKCEDPNANLYSFVGSMEFEEQKYPLSSQQLLLRDSKLRNTDYQNHTSQKSMIFRSLKYHHDLGMSTGAEIERRILYHFFPH